MYIIKMLFFLIIYKNNNIENYEKNVKNKFPIIGNTTEIILVYDNSYRNIFCEWVKTQKIFR